MYVVTSLESQKGNNFGSSEKYVRYMGKDSDGLLFDNSGNFVSVDDAYKKIDEHSRGGIRNNEARWYTPVYSFSEEECLHVASLILKNGTIYSRNITTFDDLTNEEKKGVLLKIIQSQTEFDNCQDVFISLVQEFGQYKNLGRCEQCGDCIETYTLEI